MPDNVSEIQYEEMRKAFYAGATGVLAIGSAVAEYSQDAAVMIWDSLHDESRAFVTALLAAQARAEGDHLRAVDNSRP